MTDIYQQRRSEVHSNTSITYTRDISCNGNFLLNAPEQEHPLSVLSDTVREQSGIM